MDDVIWRPDDVRLRDSQLVRYQRWLTEKWGLRFDTYEALWQWSVDDLEAFWSSLWHWFAVDASTQPTAAIVDRRMPGAAWFPGVRLNYARHLLRATTDRRPALIAVDESGAAAAVSWADLERTAAALRRTLIEAGVGEGDRVVAYLRNGPSAVAGLIACASIGAIWSCCSPDLATGGVVGRFAQLAPKALLTSDGYRFNGKAYDRRAEIEQIAAAITSIELIVCERSLDPSAPLPAAAATVMDWQVAAANGGVLAFDDLPFDHPLWVLFSSGTTGKPKGIVQSHGGILLEHLKTIALHLDLSERDRFLMITNTTWMVWNVLVSTLLVGATAVLYDGSPTYPEHDVMWRIAAEHGVTAMGVGAAYLHACAKAQLRPADAYDLKALRTLLSTGSPLSDAGFDWVTEALGEHVWINSTSGGTDVCTSLVGGCPALPVRRGRLQSKLLGVDVHAFDAAGRSVVGERGELVVRRPMPSMPIYFWDDPDGARFRETYFDMYPGVWRQGDYIAFDPDGSSVIHGRSDATLNRRGIRIGTAEIYGAVETVTGVREALVVGVELGQGDYYMPLFVALENGSDEVDEGLAAQIRNSIVENLSPRHLPDDLIAVPAIPHTKTGKKLEIPVKRLFLGAKLDDVCDPSAVDDYGALREFEARARKWAASSRP